jgi:hypothetical protein
MTLPFKEWIEYDLSIVQGTTGGDTYSIVDPATGETRKLCYNFDRAHYRACSLLNEGKTNDYNAISDAVVNKLVEEGKVSLDVSGCLPEYGYLGAEVWDGEGEFVGTIGDRCSWPAGFGTDHPGWGRCKYHGGAKVAARILSASKHGLMSRHLRSQVQTKIQKFLADPAPLDLAKELATQRALLELLMDHVVDQGDVDYLTSRVPGLMELLESIGNMANKAALIEKRYAMTAAQVLYVQHVFVEIINKYVPDPGKREEIAGELRRKLGSSASQANMAIYSARLLDAEVGE